MSFITGVAVDAYEIALGLADVAGALLTVAAEFIIQNKYIQLSENYRDMYGGSWTFYNQQFQINGEALLVDQVFNNPLGGNGEANTPFYTPQYAQQWNNVNVFRAQGAFSRFWWQNHANMYADAPLNFGCDPRGNPITVGEPEQLDIYATVDDADSYLYRYEEHRKDVYDERSWEWQNQSLNFAIKQATMVQSGIATSFKYMDEASGNVADWFATQSDGLSQYSQYKNADAKANELLQRKALEGRTMARAHGALKAIPNDIIGNAPSVEGAV